MLNLEIEQWPARRRSNSMEHVSFLSGRPRAGQFNKEAAVQCNREEPGTSPWLTQHQALTGQAGPYTSPLKPGKKPPGRLGEPDLNSQLVLDHIVLWHNPRPSPL